ncbi:MAG: CoA transferase, partial [Rhodospirillales bacterium]|nr:CoA transferase [Rhodospirillales bacterium]
EASVREMLGYPVSTVADILEDPQLAARDYWQKPKASEGDTRLFCGSFVMVNGKRPAVTAQGIADDGEIRRLMESLVSGQKNLPAPSPANNDLALDGVKIVEFGGYAAGPQIGKNLANFGATVVHVESFSRPDGFRVEYPPYKDGKPGVNRAAMFNFFNDSKHGVTLDLKKEEGKELARRLLTWADMVIENMRPGVMERLGLGYERMKAVNPGLVMLSTCNMGQTGPRANTPGFGSQLSALAGFCGLTGFPEGPPTLLFGPYIDFIASTMGTTAALAGLDSQRRNGTGSWIDLSQYESGLHFIAGALLEAETTGNIRARAGNWDAMAAPHNTYHCQGDEWLALSCWSDGEFSSLAETMGLTGDQRFSSPVARRTNAAQLDELISTWCEGKGSDATAASLQEAGIHAYPVNTIADLFTDPQLAHFGIWQKRVHSVVGEHHYCNPPFTLSATPGDILGPAPCLGEHNEIVFKEFLGISDEDYKDLDNLGAFD